MTFVLAIDQGTSGTKAILVDPEGAVVALAEVPLRPTYLKDGGVEQDPLALWDSVLCAGREAVAAAGRAPDAVALANQGETVLAWDRNTGRPLSPAIVWQDSRSSALCAALAEDAAELRALTGVELDPYFSAPKMRWLREQGVTDGVVTTTDVWLVHQLCGAWVTDASTASRSALLDLDEVAWSPRAREIWGLAGETLPLVVGSDEVVGETDLFGPPVPVTGLMVDQQAALLAESCVAPGQAKCTYGTGAFLLANVGEQALRSSAGLTTSVAWQLGGRTAYCIDAQVFTAAAAVRWAVDLGLLTRADQLDHEAADDAGGVWCVPALAGLGAPWWRSTAGASVVGLGLGSQRGHVVRALVEGIAAQVAVLINAVAHDLGSPLARLRADGGLTRSRVLMQAQADLAQLPVDVYPTPHATALGAAAAARLALEPALTVGEAVPSWQATETFEPSWSPDRAASYLEQWSRLAEQTVDR